MLRIAECRQRQRPREWARNISAFLVACIEAPPLKRLEDLCCARGLRHARGDRDIVSLNVEVVKNSTDLQAPRLVLVWLPFTTSTCRSGAYSVHFLRG